MSEAERDVVGKAIGHLDRGEDHEAAAILGPHVLRYPSDTEALFRFGVSLARTQRLEDAVRIFARVVELDPQHGRALWNLGRARLLMDDPYMAEPLLRLALAAAPEEGELWGVSRLPCVRSAVPATPATCSKTRAAASPTIRR